MRKNYKKINYYVLVIAALLCNLSLTAAELTTVSLADVVVTGQVMDETSKPIPGVNVIIKGTSKGTSTDQDGKFSIAVPDENAILVFSFIGYSAKEVIVGSRTVINVSLDPDVSTLEEVVVVGYGSQTKSSVTGAVSSVSSKEIVTQPVSSVSAALQGRVPGV